MHHPRSSRLHNLLTILLFICIGATVTAAGSADGQAAARSRARAVLRTSGIRGGLVVHLGCDDGSLTAALRAGDSFVVQGLARNREDVTRARHNIQERGEYGPVSVRRWHGERLPYADNTVKLLVSERPISLPEEEVMRALAPRGVACVKKDGRWTTRTSPWPDDMDEWTHSWHASDSNPVAEDTEVGPPRHIQWVGQPRWQRHHDTVPSTTTMVSSGGRLFYIADVAPASLAGKNFDKWFLIARDAFSGAILWKQPMKGWGAKGWSNTWWGRGNQPYEISKRLVAVGDTVYVTLGFDAPVTALDAASGEELMTCEGTEGASEILHCDGRLIVAVRNRPGRPGRDNEPVREHVCAIDADSGEMLWKSRSYVGLHANAGSGDGIKCLRPFGRLELTAADGKVFLMNHETITCLDMDSGEKKWEQPRPDVARKWVMHWSTRSQDTGRLVYADETLLLAQPEIEVFNPYDTIPGTLYAFDAETGRRMWEQLYGDWSHVDYQPDLFVVDERAWVHKHLENKNTNDYELLGLDLETGQVERRFSTTRAFSVGHHHRCYSNRSTTEFVLSSHRGVEFLELDTGTNWLNHWVRGTCLFGYLPCNGLLYAPPDPCQCFIRTKLNGYYALSADQKHALDLPVDSWDRPLEKGPASGQAGQQGASGAAPWPTWRHDARRSGSASTDIPGELETGWSAQVGDGLTSPTIGYGRIYTSVRGRHQVVALDAETGELSWSFTAGARVDTPPTLYEGLALFGARDGWVYCVTADDGRLVWRRRIAPQARFVGAHDGVESTWPLHGSVLVENDLAYVVAGRSSYLDGGIFACALKPETGEVVKEKNIYSPDPETGRQPYGAGNTWSVPGVLNDILTSDGSTVYLRRQTLFEGSDGAAPVFATGGMLDNSFFSRIRWGRNGSDAGELAVFDGPHTYGIEAYRGGGKGTGRGEFFWPGDDGYRLFRTRKNGGGRGDGWSRHIPVRGKAMILAGQRLVVAGPPDVAPADDPLAAFEGLEGGRLWTISVSDGEPVQKLTLDSPPVWQGLAAAHGRLYLADRSGTLHCFTGE